jgi:ribosomal protein S18 acetylase RimI-like enzyme
LDEIDISPILVEHLRQDASGSMIKQMSDLAYHAFREPPWNDDLEVPRLHFGLGVDLMRRSAKAWIAWSKPARKVVGYILGYEAFLQSGNARDLSLRDICGSDALNYLFEGATRVFYEDTLCVDPQCRRQHIAQKLSFALIDALRDEGFTYLTGRTSIAAEAMRRLFVKLQFEELPVHDTLSPERTYWLLKI